VIHFPTHLGLRHRISADLAEGIPDGVAEVIVIVIIRQLGRQVPSLHGCRCHRDAAGRRFELTDHHTNNGPRKTLTLTRELLGSCYRSCSVCSAALRNNQQGLHIQKRATGIRRTLNPWEPHYLLSADL